jgi:hypothetical protein
VKAAPTKRLVTPGAFFYFRDSEKEQKKTPELPLGFLASK